jgi:hypothetical protein
MASIKDKNLLFYSVHQNDQISREFLSELEKNPMLKKQFILVCVSDPKIHIPDKIKQLNKVPVLVTSGLNRPIFGSDAISWLKNNSFQEKANGFEYGSLDNDTSKYAFLGDESKVSDYNQFFNNDYNHGFVEKDSTLNKQFANLKTDAHISTYDDSNEMKKDISAQMDQRLSQLRQQRDADVPKPIKRMGGLEGVGGGNGFQQNQMGGDNGNVPTYNQNPFGNHNMPQQPRLPFQTGSNPQLPFSMPMSPSQMSMRPNASQPTLPFQMNHPVNRHL